MLHLPLFWHKNASNRRVKFSQRIPRDELANGIQSLSSTHGRPAKDARLVIGAVT